MARWQVKQRYSIVWAWPDLTRRSESLELMDDFSIGGAELVETLTQLRWINRLLGAAWPTLEGVSRLWRQAGQPAQLSILDVGAGSGDINRRLLRWATGHNIHLTLTLVDIHPDTCAVAADYYRDEPRVQVQQGDIFQLDPQQADIVTASLFLHHFPTAQVAAVLQAMLGAARLGVVINDLHRHSLAWAGILAATRLLSQNRLIRHDAPLSVRRGFRAADFRQLQDLPELAGLTYTWRPFFRYLVIIPKAASVSAPEQSQAQDGRRETGDRLPVSEPVPQGGFALSGHRSPVYSQRSVNPDEL